MTDNKSKLKMSFQGDLNYLSNMQLAGNSTPITKSDVSFDNYCWLFYDIRVLHFPAAAARKSFAEVSASHIRNN
jgi:hypothetical protein